MEKQLTFGDYLDGNNRPTPSVHVETFKASAKMMDRSSWKSSKRRAIYGLIKTREVEGATCDEIEVALELRHQSASSLIRSMTKDDLLYATTERRMTRSGRKAIVWKATLKN